MSKDDARLRQDVEDELRWDPRVNAARIAVSVERGQVALTGVVDTTSVVQYIRIRSEG